VKSNIVKLGLFAAICVALGYGLNYLRPVAPPASQTVQKDSAKKEDKPKALPEATPTNALAAGGANAPAGTNILTAGTNAPAATNALALLGTNAPMALGGTNAPGTNQPPSGTNALAKTESQKGGTNEEIQVSFQGANIEMIVQWLAKTTDKSVVKHPRVQCQLTIMSSKKLPPRDAVNLVYRALAVEGFTTVESKSSIFIVPEGQEPKMMPELMDASSKDVPEGRQRLVKFFPLKHIQGAELKEKIRAVLSEKGTIDVDERANQIIVTDYNDNMRLLGELVKELDVVSVFDTIVEIFPLKYLEAEEASSLLGMIINSQAPGASSSGGGSRPSRGGGEGPGGPGGMSMGVPGGGSSSPSAAGGSSSSGQQVRIWPDKSTNRLIVSAPKNKLAEVQKLLDLLDSDKAKDMTVRVLPMKNVSAEDLAREIVPLYQKLSSKSPKDSVEVTANSRSNSLIILSSEANFKAIEKLIASLDTEDAQEKVMQAFPLKNADAEDVAKQLQELNQDSDSSSSRYSYYYGYNPFSRGSGKKLSVVSDRRRNTVIVQAPPSSMERVTKMIEKLDEPVTDNSLAPKIFALKFVSAVDIEDVLNELFLKKQQQRSYWSFYDDGPSETADKNVGRLYGKVRITSEPYSNSLIVTANSPENLAAVEEVIKKLDSPSQAGDTTMRVGLQFAKAHNVADSVNILFAKGGSPALRPMNQQGQPNQPNNQQQQGMNQPQNSFELEQEAKEDSYYPWLGGQQENYRSSDGRNSVRPVSDLVGKVRVVPDKRSNSLLVTCNVHYFPQVMKLISEMDEPSAQVLIEAKILEVGSDFRDKLGVRWSPDGAASFSADDKDGALQISSKAEYMKVFTGNTLANSLKTGVLDSTIKMDVLVQFLRKNTDATVLAEPQINIADNELGRLFVGAQIPLLNNSQLNTLGGRNDAYTYKDVGVILEVTPHINNTEEVALKIRTESSSLRNGETLNGGAIIDTRNFRTDIMVKNGETVILGGIIQKEQQNIVRKVPVLGSIPGLGWFFKKKDKIDKNVELLVFLSPRITRTPEQARELVNDIEKKNPKIKQYNDEEKLPKDVKGPKKDKK
jgi:type II secretion system protein D